MPQKKPFLLPSLLALLAIMALACANLGGNDTASAPTINQDAIIEAAVATVEAQQPTIFTPTDGQQIALIDSDLQETLITLYNSINPSVVHVFSTQGTGSGFVYDTEGHIITNNHVIAGSQQFEIVYSDGSRSDAVVVGTDVDSDLAVMRAENPPASARPLPLGDSGSIQVGQFVIAIGNPFQQQSSLSFGIVSGLGRSLRSMRDTETGGFYSLPQVIQTDAPINPGNSGGPLLSLDGQVVGVNSAISSETGFNSGVGFSIPVNIVKRVAPALIADGEYVYPFMGVGIESINLFIQEQLGLANTRGALIVNVTEGQPAAEAGLQRDDVVTAINGDPINDSDGLISYLVFETEVGQTVDLTVVRDGDTISIPLTLGARP